MFIYSKDISAGNMFHPKWFMFR